MSWYSIIKSMIKVAGPKEKIQKYGVTDPALQLLIMRYEGMIKWNGYTVEGKNEAGQDTQIQKSIENQNDINDFIKAVLLPKVFAKVDQNNPNSNYIKKFDVEAGYNFARQNNIFNPELEHAYNMAKYDKEGAEKFYVGVINNIKKQAFDGWITYVKDHPDYSNSPAFVYLLLNPVFDSSGPKTINPAPSASPPVIAQIFQKVKNVKFKYNGPIKDENIFKKVLALAKEGKPIDQVAQEVNLPPEQVQDAINQNNSRNIDIFKDYEKSLVEHSLAVAKQGYNEADKTGWLKLPSKDKTKEGIDKDGKPIDAEKVFQNNVEILHNFSVPNAWCTTKNSNGPRYLSAGDFWILVENGKANVGIRFSGEDIVEIAGDQSYAGGVSRSCPTAYWREITDIIYREGLEPRITSYAKTHWDQILKEANLNKSFFNEDGTPNLEEIEEFRKMLLTNPALYNRVTENDKFAQYPQLLESLQTACKEGWFKKVQNLGGNDALQMAENVAANAQNMPEFVLRDPAFMENVHGRLTALYENSPDRIRNVLEKVPNHWRDYPRGKEVFKHAVLRKYQEGLYWKANVFSASRKTKEQKGRIATAKIEYDALQQVIGDLLPELHADKDFEQAVNVAKNQSAEAAVREGYIAIDTPRPVIDRIFADPANVEEMAEKYADKISKAHLEPHSRQTETSVLLDSYMDSEFSAIAPLWARKTPGFQNFINLTKKKVLIKNIHNFPSFDPRYKEDPELYRLYKEQVLANDPLKKKLVGKDKVDERLLQDKDYQAAVGNFDQGIEQVLKTMKWRASVYLTLPPQVQENPQVVEAYIQSRVYSTNMNFQNALAKEFTKLPEFLKENPVIQQKYIEVVKRLMRTAMPGDKINYINCNELDIIATQDPEIVEMCNKRNTPLNFQVEENFDNEDPGMDFPQKNASKGWYRKAATTY